LYLIATLLINIFFKPFGLTISVSDRTWDMF